MIPFWTALSLGLVSGLHCMGMCGPIAGALPIQKRTYLTVWAGITGYNLGRISTYMILGGLFGLLGTALITVSLQQNLSIGLGVIFLLSVILPAVGKKTVPLESWAYKAVAKLMGKFKSLFKKNSWESLFFIGVLNGLLPCGMVYLALVGAIATGSWDGGVIYMLLFGVGTLPVMVGVTWAGKFISVSLRNKLKVMVPVIISIMGILFILRGLNLGIPYISPELVPLGEGATECH